MIADGTLLVGGRGARDLGGFPRLPVTPFVEPPPVPAATDARLLRGAWLWSCRKVLGLKLSDDDRGQYMMKGADAQAALALRQEKGIAPAAWLAWRAAAFVREPNHPPGIGWLVGLSILEEPQKRGWFRRSTDGAFGGRVAMTKTQLEIVQRWVAARAAWSRGLASLDESLARAGLAPVQLDALLSIERGEVERARARCAQRAAHGDPMPTQPPTAWSFKVKESEEVPCTP